MYEINGSIYHSGGGDNKFVRDPKIKLPNDVMFIRQLVMYLE
jgi:hypothetical protein